MIEMKTTPEFRNYIESLQYEVEARKDLLCFAMRKELDQTDAWKRYNQEYIELYAQYQIAKEDITNNIVKKQYPNASHWNLNFSTGVLEVEVPANESSESRESQ